MTIIQHDTPLCRCTNCGKLLDAATGIGNHKPKPDDVTLCLYCGHFMIFDADLKVREPTDAEIKKWAGTEGLVYASKVVQEIRDETKEEPL